MPRHEITYPPEIRHSISGERLYYYWKKIRGMPHVPAFDEFLTFYHWAMGNGYADDMKLRRVDPSLPWGPDNCAWDPIIPPKKTCTQQEKETVALWNKTVNRIRIHYGLEPFPVEEGATAC